MHIMYLLINTIFSLQKIAGTCIQGCLQVRYANGKQIKCVQLENYIYIFITGIFCSFANSKDLISFLNILQKILVQTIACVNFATLEGIEKRRFQILRGYNFHQLNHVRIMLQVLVVQCLECYLPVSQFVVLEVRDQLRQHHFL